MSFLFDTKQGRDFFTKQIEKDNKAIDKIERAVRRGDAKEIARIEKQWRKEEKRDRIAFNKANRD
jgi:hypothetical protein